MKRTNALDRRHVLTLAIGLALVVVRTQIGHGEDELRARLLAEAPKSWAKISQWAEHLDMTTTDRVEQGNVRARTDGHLKLSGENLLFITTNFGPDDRLQRQDAYCRNERYSFHLRRSDPKLPWRVQRFGSTRNRDFEYIFFEGLRVKDTSQPQLSVGVYFPDVFGGESFLIREVKSQRQGATELVSVAFENAIPDTEKPVRWLSRGAVTLNPDLDWVIQDCDVYVEFAAGFTWHLQVESDIARQEGIPVVKSQRRRINIKDQPEARLTYALNSLSKRKIPDDEFKLTAFGLPEMTPESSSEEDSK